MKPDLSQTSRHIAAMAVVAILTVTLALAVAPAARADARADYASLFGEEEKKVLATSFTKDDAAFAAKLLACAADLKDAQELQRLVLSRAVDLGQKDTEGLVTAIDAAKQIIATAPGTEKLDWRGKLVDLYTAQYKRATGAKRAEAGEFLLGVLEKEADELVAEAKYADALKRLNEARDIARSIRSSQVDDFLSAAKELQAKQQTAEKYAKLRQKLDAQGGDVALLEQVIIGYLLEVNDLDTARKLAAGHPDKSWEKTLMTAERDRAAPAATRVEDLAALAAWFESVIDKPGVPAHVAIGAAHRYRSRTILAHGKKDAVTVQAQAGLDRLMDRALKISPRATFADELVIWNSHNGTYNDRGSRSVQISLSLRGRVIWSSQQTPIPWAANERRKISVTLPALAFDRIRVKVPEWQGKGPALSEVELFAAGLEVAPTRLVATVSSVAAPPFPATKLLDADLDGPGWLAFDNMPAWVDLEVQPVQK